MKKVTTPIFLFLIAVIGFGGQSCTETYKKKQTVADGLIGDMGATSVSVGYSTKAEAGSETISKTTLTFKGVDFTDDVAGEIVVNRVAQKFITGLSKEDLKDETHLEIVIDAKDKLEYTFMFRLTELAMVPEFQAITDAMIKACVEKDTVKIQELKDNEYMPDDQMSVIYDVNQYVDSLYMGQKMEQENVGFRLTNGADNKDLKLFSANYVRVGTEFLTQYTINVDRKSKKVVYIWMNTDPK